MASLALILTGLDALFQESIAIMAIIRLFGADFNTTLAHISTPAPVIIAKKLLLAPMANEGHLVRVHSGSNIVRGNINGSKWFVKSSVILAIPITIIAVIMTIKLTIRPSPLKSMPLRITIPEIINSLFFRPVLRLNKRALMTILHNLRRKFQVL